MSRHRTFDLVLVVAVAACLLGTPITAALGAPSAARTAADRAAVDRAVQKLDAARKRSADVASRVKQTSGELDRVVAQQQRARDRLSARATSMYRSGEVGFISVLLGASSFENFAERWDLLTRMNRQDAEDLRQLAIARTKAERAARALMDLQSQQTKAVAEQAAEVVKSRKELAASQSALKAYEAKVEAAAAFGGTASTAPKAAATSAPVKKSGPSQSLAGSGAWKTSLASHYSWTFGSSGHARGASGKSITPDSMMVAHETLPFGTLIEFEYDGKRAVASVEDRGPYSPPREFDLGPGLARYLDFTGVHDVRWRVIGR